MKDIILKRCCGNCDWSISPILEKEIMKENNYEEDDPTRPRAGDCCLGIMHDENYFCNEHTYISGGLETYAFYDKEDLGPGYYVVTEYYDHIIRYFKIYRTGEYGNYSYGIRAYEINPITSDGTLVISFEIEEIDNKVLYKLFSIFAKALGNNDIRNAKEHNGIVSVTNYDHSINIQFIKVINNKENNNFIDIIINCNKKDKNYRLMEHLFRNMAVVTSNKKDLNNLKKVRKISK